MNHLHLSPDAGSSVLNSIGVISSDYESPGSILCPFTSWAGWEVDVAETPLSPGVWVWRQHNNFNFYDIAKFHSAYIARYYGFAWIMAQ